MGCPGVRGKSPGQDEGCWGCGGVTFGGGVARHRGCEMRPLEGCRRRGCGVLWGCRAVGGKHRERGALQGAGVREGAGCWHGFPGAGGAGVLVRCPLTAVPRMLSGWRRAGAAGSPQHRGSRPGPCPADGATSPPQSPAAARCCGGAVPPGGPLPRGSPAQPPGSLPCRSPQVLVALRSRAGSGRVYGGGPGERQLPHLGACPDLLRIPGIAAGLVAGLGVQVPAHTHIHTDTHTLAAPPPAFTPPRLPLT